MLELKFAICHRAASLPSQASYAVLPEHSSHLHTNCMFNLAILHNNYCNISLLSDLCPSEEEDEERKTFWPSGDFLVRYFRNAFSTNGYVVNHENT